MKPRPRCSACTTAASRNGRGPRRSVPAAVAEPKKRGVRRARSGSFPADPDPPPAPESGECHERLVRCYLPYNNTIRVLAGRFSGRLSETCQAASFFGTSALRALFPIVRFSKEGRSSVGRPVLSCAAFARDRPLSVRRTTRCGRPLRRQPGKGGGRVRPGFVRNGRAQVVDRAGMPAGVGG